MPAPSSKTRHQDTHCKGYSHTYLHPTAAIGKMLRVERLGFETLTPELVGHSAKLTIFSPDCPECQHLVYREMERRMRV